MTKKEQKAIAKGIVESFQEQCFELAESYPPADMMAIYQIVEDTLPKKLARMQGKHRYS